MAVGNGSAYDLYLARELKKARIERAATSPEVTDFFLKRNLDVAAGVKQQLEADAKRLPGLRLAAGIRRGLREVPRVRVFGVRLIH